MNVEDRSVFELPFEKPDKSSSYGNFEDQVIDFYYSAKPSDCVIVLIHGGYWRPEYDRKHLAPLARALSTTGWSVALIEYRRIIGNPDAMLSDTQAAIGRIKEEFSKIVLIGHSAGGHLALVLSNNIGAIGTIALAPVTDLIEAEKLDLDEGAVSDFLGAPASLRSDLDPARLPAPLNPTTIIHGTLDARVPVQFSRDYVAQKIEANMDLVEIENIGHFELIDPRSDIFRQISRILTSLI
ncbi:MAG: alpha/beta hydrolase [Actinomycetes bacterium]